MGENLETSEITIVEKCRDGQLENFALLYNEYADRIYRFVYHRTFHKATAEDLVSQIFLKTLERVDTFNPARGNFSSWIFRIARNAVIDYYRTNKQTVDIFEIPEPHDQGLMEFDTDNKLKLDTVSKYLSKLDSEQREIVLLRVWDGLSFKEIGEIIGKTDAACKMSFSRTMKKLQKAIPVGLLLVWLLNFSISVRL